MNTIIRIAITTAALAITVCASASETDQYFDRSKPMADSTEALNKKFNETLAKVIARHHTVRDNASSCTRSVAAWAAIISWTID